VKSRPFRIVDANALRALMEQLLLTAGLSRDSAAVCAEVFLEADLRGYPTQGIHQIRPMLLAMRHERAKPAAVPRVVAEREASALVDGGAGPGQVALRHATDVAIRKARKAGSCSVGVTNAYDVFMLGYYAERVARAGLVGIAMTAGSPLVHPFGGVDRVLGTNPLAIAVPTDGSDPIIVDLATSALSSGRVLEAYMHGETLPEGAAVGADGLPTREPAAAMSGANAPLGGHKGYGLGLCVALLAGPLVRARVGRAAIDAEAGGPRGKRGHVLTRRGSLVIAIDPAAFGEPREFCREVGAYVREIKSSRKAPGVEGIRVPGERAAKEKARRLRDGVPVYETVWAEVERLALECGVPLPDHARA
jgi:LDH2 family malate/lactate/ureidoglycolate dehydrogenase